VTQDGIALQTGYPFPSYPTGGATGAVTTYIETNLNPRAFYRIRRY